MQQIDDMDFIFFIQVMGSGDEADVEEAFIDQVIF